VIAVADPTDRDLKDLWRLQHKAGGRAGLIRWLDKHPDQNPNRKVGRPSEDELDSYLIHLAYGLLFPETRKKRQTPAALRAAIRALRESREKSAQDETLPDHVRAAYAKPLWNDEEAVMFRLLAKWRKMNKQV
jgi:hypothetical protein